MAIDNSGPAFPALTHTGDGGRGLTRHEWFAGMALQGLLCNPLVGWIAAIWPSFARDLAREHASAMLREKS